MSALNVGDLVKPIDTLIHKISDATGVLYEPRRIRHKAKAELDAAVISARAEAEVAIIKTESEIEIADLRQRAEQRRIKEDMRDQKNMENIIAQAVPDVNEKAKPDDMEDDWIANFFDKCRRVSDTEMQNLWARVLAGEANTPGTYAKRTVNLIAELDKSEAELFTRLCGFSWSFGIITPLVFDTQAGIYDQHGIDFDTLSNLESIGLIQFQNSGVKRLNLPKTFVVCYYGEPLRLELPKEDDNELSIGKVLLTQIGQELAPISGSKPVESFFEYVKDQWKEYVPKVENVEQNK